jgi:hypothetical protein
MDHDESGEEGATGTAQAWRAVTSTIADLLPAEAPKDAAGVVAHLAAVVRRQAVELDGLRRENQRLRLALEHRAVIEQAKGMVARDHSVSVEVAFEWLRRHSRNTNIPVRDLASAVVDLGLHVPGPPPHSRRVIAVAQRRRRDNAAPPRPR